jgi:Tol biopolymer transport system component
MDSDGTNSHPLTDDTVYNHTGIAWSPDNENLAFIRFNTANLNETMELWLIHATTGISSKVLVAGYDPQWVP